MKGINSHAKRALRKNLCDKFGGLCAYCDVRVGKRGTVDHYVPQALGGTNEFSNLRWSCLSCNQLKGGMPPKEWEMHKPPSRRVETKYDKRIRLLAGIAQRGNSLWWFFIVLAVTVPGVRFLESLVKTEYESRCLEGFKFYGRTQILDAQGRGIPCEGVRPSAPKPLT